MPAALRVTPWPDPVIDVLGVDPRSWYAETFWLPTLGPTALLLLRHLADRFEREPAGVDLPVAETAAALGLGARDGEHSPLAQDVEPAEPVRARAPRRRLRRGQANASARAPSPRPAAARRAASASHRVDRIAAGRAGRARAPPRARSRAHAARAGRTVRRGRTLAARRRFSPCARSRSGAVGPRPFRRVERRRRAARGRSQRAPQTRRCLLVPHGHRRCGPGRRRPPRPGDTLARRDLRRRRPRWSTDLDTIAGWLRDASYVVVLTGAGISTESGVPDFRGPNGVWTKNPGAEKTATLQHYMGDPEVRKRAWQNRVNSEMWSAQPNDGASRARRAGAQGSRAHARDAEHRQPAPLGGSIARHRHRDPRQRARGEVHGVRMARADGRDAGARARPAKRTRVPVCGGILKSATISFGENLVPDDLDRAQLAAARADVFLAIGTSLTVYPAAAGLPEIALRQRRPAGDRERGGDAARRCRRRGRCASNSERSCPIWSAASERVCRGGNTSVGLEPLGISDRWGSISGPQQTTGACSWPDFATC